MKRDLRIIFMGTPDFAVPSLEILVKHGFNIVGVITAPDKPAGRGLKLHESPVKKCAMAHNIPLLQPTNLKSPEFIEELKSYNANLQVVVAFRMLPEVVWAMPAYGTFNLHGSLLPQYRGAAPINWAVINGEKETGVTTFFLKHQIDTGDLIDQAKVPIHENDTAGSVYERLMYLGADLVLKTVKSIEANNYTLSPQDESVEIKKAPKIFKETCEIDFSKSTEEVYNFIRGLSPYPTAWTTLNGKSCKIYEVEKVENPPETTQNNPYISDRKNYLYFKTDDGFISVKTLQLAGKKRMYIEDFLRGYKFQ
ncbi:methionyl-tRNA formyltransferase [Flexithrix dorotheae]|uniref:methionyl-tRNA formyltransferase n=1 Tax=Flexithrix dorotheae TaxID=70993 RepID=UPI00035D144E|nr:methionyl-tRNA formyltransferase [Flexithrix dorotheae]